MLSVLIPTYNVDVTTLVKSISGQLATEKYPYEILVLDDASPDFSITEKNKRIEEYPHCKYIIQPENKGRTATRNNLAYEAQYNWLLFMDADVMPENENFITAFNIESTDADLIFGGISYEEIKPDQSKMLRWKYGKFRESRTVEQRKKIPYLSLISGCSLIKKDVFLDANNFLENKYGADVLFAKNLEKNNIKVQHIDNPVLHLGLESNTSFIEKTKHGLDSLHYFEKEGIVPEDYRPIQKAYQSLKKNGALKLFNGVFGYFEKAIAKNLKSSSPSLFLFDLYRLNYYAQLQKNKNE